MNWSARVQLANDLLSEDRYADAWEELQRISPQDDGLVDVLFIRMQALWALQRFPEALSLARRIVELSPEKAIYWAWLGVTTQEAIGIEAATAIYEDAVNRYPDTGVFRYCLASRYLRLGRHHEANEHMVLGLELDPSCTWLWAWR